MFDPYAKPQNKIRRVVNKWLISFLTSLVAIFFLCCITVLVGVLGILINLSMSVIVIAFPILAILVLAMGIAGVFKWADW